LNQFLSFTEYLVVSYFLTINLVYLVLIIISFFYIRRQIGQKEVFSLSGLFSSNLYNPISILAPAYNEESTVVASVRSLLQLQFPNYEVIVINDGSKDKTMQVLIDTFKLRKVDRYVPLMLTHKPIKAIYKSDLYPELLVVDKENGRKADALNAGINVSRNDLICSIDADSVLEPKVLQSMIRTFIEDDTTIAVGGIVRIANDCVFENNELKEIRMPKSFLGRIQVVEYLRAFLFGRVGWDYLDSLLIISGAFGLFDRKAVLKVGGYLHDTVGEDMELVVRLHRYYRENKIPYRVRFVPEPVCWTEVPEEKAVLARQRNRWQRGLADTLWRHRKMMFNPVYGRLGMFAMPFFFFIEMLGPIVEVGGYVFLFLSWVFGALNVEFAVVFLTASVLLGMVLSVASVLCEEFTYRRYPDVKHIFVMFLYALLENFGYRQMHSWWRLMGLVDFLKGNKSWGEMTRKGLGAATPKTVTVDVPKPPRKFPFGLLFLFLFISSGVAYKYRADIWPPEKPPFADVLADPGPASADSLALNETIRTEALYYLVLGTFESETNAERFVSGMRRLRDSVQVRAAVEPSGLPVYRITAGAFDRNLSTQAMRSRLRIDSTLFSDAYARMHDSRQQPNPEALRLSQFVRVRTADTSVEEGYYHLVIAMTTSLTEAERMVESLDTLKSEARIVELRHQEVRTVYKVALGRFKQPYHTFRLRAWYGLREDQFVDAYTERFELP
jgi:cellulose synthase/poly-beta-1,6-N-acetylglucosamine synthase-like glycosyltransferase